MTGEEKREREERSFFSHYFVHHIPISRRLAEKKATSSGWRVNSKSPCHCASVSTKMAVELEAFSQTFNTIQLCMGRGNGHL